MGDTVTALVSGLLVMGYAVAGLFFLRFWRETRDRLFGIFAGAFWLLAVQRLLLALFQNPDNEQVWLYGIRLLAFVLILVAIVDKNRGGG
jgi:peptidoglycan/LPS O-acetylase OafA/YrhL